jgi:hypothetical protein
VAVHRVLRDMLVFRGDTVTSGMLYERRQAIEQCNLDLHFMSRMAVSSISHE